MGIPFGSRRYHFRAYRDFMNAVPAALKSVPVLITETQPADPDWWQNQNKGWLQAAFKEINDWNALTTNQPIQALCVFRWLTGEPRWSIADKPAVQSDFQTALQKNYLVRFPAPPPDPVATAVATEAKKFTWMPINTDAALYKFAQANNLGYPQTDEFTFTHDNADYLGQVFNRGIVFVKKGDWGNVQWVKKPQ
jgi:hypothetical protein